MGAVLGRDFAYEMLRAITVLDEPRLRDVLGRLVEAELLYQRGRPPRARYMFKHALIQDAAYQSLLRRTRQQYHRQVAELLESNLADTVEASPELVAHHYSEAGLPGPAVTYWLRAGENATKRSANLEAIGHLTAGLAQLAQLPDAPQRAKHELALQRLLGQASFAAKGYASPEATPAFSKRAGAVRHGRRRRQHLSDIGRCSAFRIDRRTPCKCRDDRQGDARSGVSHGKYRRCDGREVSSGRAARSGTSLRTMARMLPPSLSGAWAAKHGQLACQPNVVSK